MKREKSFNAAAFIRLRRAMEGRKDGREGRTRLRGVMRHYAGAARSEPEEFTTEEEETRRKEEKR